jgi:hypothetical protein
MCSLTKEEMQDIVNIFLEFTKRTSEISLDGIMDRLIKFNKIEKDGALRVARLVGRIGRVCSDAEKTDAFIESVKPLVKSQESVKQLQAFLKQLSEKGSSMVFSSSINNMRICGYATICIIGHWNRL